MCSYIPSSTEIIQTKSLPPQRKRPRRYVYIFQNNQSRPHQTPTPFAMPEYPKIPPFRSFDIRFHPNTLPRPTKTIFPPKTDVLLHGSFRLFLDQCYLNHAFIVISVPHSSTLTSQFGLSRLTISLTSSLVYFRIVTFITARPEFSLSSSCALIQHLAIRFFAISTPPGSPALTLPPSHHGFCTRSKLWRKVVRGSAARGTRWWTA